MEEIFFFTFDRNWLFTAFEPDLKISAGHLSLVEIICNLTAPYLGILSRPVTVYNKLSFSICDGLHVVF